jgi:ABC-type Mn2+/Zn2+ transport system permease subunit
VTFDLLGDLNWPAVIVAAFAYFVIGAIWYAPPIFGKVWSAAGGMALPAEGQRPPPTIYAVPLIGGVLSAIALGMLATASDTDTVSESLVLGIVVAIGFAVSIALVTATFESNKPKPMVWGAINAGYHVVGNLVAALIISLWT